MGLLGSFWLEAFATPRSGAVLRALLVSVEVVAQFRAHRWPKGNMLGAHWLRFAVWLLLLGLWGDAVMAGQGAAYRMAFLHLCYAGGFAPNSDHRHLFYAALCWLLGMLVWSATILWRVATHRER